MKLRHASRSIYGIDRRVREMHRGCGRDSVRTRVNREYRHVPPFDEVTFPTFSRRSRRRSKINETRNSALTRQGEKEKEKGSMINPCITRAIENVPFSYCSVGELMQV